jgi:2-methylisocitrate lyase-like PEP mutase family enzyme
MRTHNTRARARHTGNAQMANMLEGGGKTPILPPEELQALGFKLVAYPLSLLGVSIKAMQGARGFVCMRRTRVTRKLAWLRGLTATLLLPLAVLRGALR